MHPPNTTAATFPISLDVTPLSNEPNSFDDITNMLFSEATLPFMASGVFNCKIVDLTITLIPSSIPDANNAKKEVKQKADMSYVTLTKEATDLLLDRMEELKADHAKCQRNINTLRNALISAQIPVPMLE